MEATEQAQIQARISDNELMDIVKQGSEGGTQIIPSKYTNENLPSLDELVLPSNLTEDEAKKASRYLGFLKTYATTPIVADHFPDHTERVIAHKKQLEEVLDTYGEAAAARMSEIIDNTKLSGNRIGYTSQAVYVLDKLGLTLPSEAVQTIRESTRQMVEMQQPRIVEKTDSNGQISHKEVVPWYDITQDERIEFVDKIGDAAAEVYLSFAPTKWKLQAEE